MATNAPMTTLKQTEKAREIADLVMSKSLPNTVDSTTRLIAAALSAERDEVIREAAELCENGGPQEDTPQTPDEWTCNYLARSIRRLASEKEAPDETR